MTNLTSIAGGTLWALIATLLLAAALEPVSTGSVAHAQTDQTSTVVSA
ncbi:MAG: hypothetical protein H0W74_00600 [Sphingosinicella sp.]|nr:hypothetical protein [Sphingosinicella sp.]